jgi:hypothetical protein
MSPGKWHDITSLFVLLMMAVVANAQPPASKLKEASKAYNQFRLDESRTLYNEIVKDPSAAVADKVAALQKLAEQDWQIYVDRQAAMKKLNQAIDLKEDESGSYQLRGKINREATLYKEALSDAADAIAASRNETTRQNAELLKSGIIHDQNIDRVRNGKSVDKKQLAIASALLNKILDQQPGRPAPAELLIGVSLLLNDGPTMLKAWKSYFFIQDEKNVNEVLLPAYQSLEGILPIWYDRVLTYKDLKSVITALAQSRFYNYATLMIRDLFPSHDRFLQAERSIRLIPAYQEFIEGIASVNKKFYPEIARGKKNYEREYDDAIAAKAKLLWIQFGSAYSLLNYTDSLFFLTIKEKFGAEGYIGHTVGYYGMLMGHVIHHEMKSVNQYGYAATFQYTSVDRMISQDFTTWYGATNVGGWGTDSSMVQVRGSYLSDPFQRLAWMIDTAEKRKIGQRIADAKSNDMVKCSKDPYADASHLGLSLKYDASVKLFDSLQKAGLQQSELYLVFIAETMRLSIESSVFAHEGRHAIDQLFFKKEFEVMSDDERELRAKYSEVIFSSNPKLAFTGSIFGGDLDEKTNHGKANMRFRKSIVGWMEKHKSEIKGIDASKPLLFQFDLLSNQQITSMCLEFDELSKRKPH